jgi:hypothetical protein
VKEDKDKDKDRGHIEVIILYNGLEREVDAQPQQNVQALLELAMNAFGVHQNRHLMALFFVEPLKELEPLTQSLKDAGVVNGTKLLLRPSAVRGGVR